MAFPYILDIPLQNASNKKRRNKDDYLDNIYPFFYIGLPFLYNKMDSFKSVMNFL